MERFGIDWRVMHWEWTLRQRTAFVQRLIEDHDEAERRMKESR